MKRLSNLSVFTMLYRCLLLLATLCLTVPAQESNRTFPEGFLFGAASSAFQTEGAWLEDGKGLSAIDVLLTVFPEFVVTGENAQIAADSYHKYSEDARICNELGLDFARISISWPRIFPDGTNATYNQKGIDHYNKVIDAMISQNVTPMVALFHWDIPMALQATGGWENPEIIDNFVDYAEVMFSALGDRVKYWVTMVQPGVFANEISNLFGDSGAGYRIGRNMLIAHAKAYHLYKAMFTGNETGMMSLANLGYWEEPRTSSQEDIDAANRALQFRIGWFAHPIFSESGDYPPSMRERVDALSKADGEPVSRLPYFTPEEVELIKGTSDFFALNHYYTWLDSNREGGRGAGWDVNDAGVASIVDPSWPIEANTSCVPWGFRKILNWIKNEYNNVPIIVTENGWSDHGQLDDFARAQYHVSYMQEMLKAIYEDGVDVLGYTIWSYIDTFEWDRGYRDRFGLYYVNVTDPDRPRTPKFSAGIIANITREKRLPDDPSLYVDVPLYNP